MLAFKLYISRAFIEALWEYIDMSLPESPLIAEEALRKLVEDVDSDAEDFQELNIAMTGDDEDISSDVEEDLADDQLLDERDGDNQRKCWNDFS